MNLKDLLDEGGLQQDEWSLTAPTFGKEGQLTVVGWSGRLHGHKNFILKCDVCSKDSELFGEGYFRSLKARLNKGGLPCGCGRAMWTKEQYATLCSRKAEDTNYTFLGFDGEWNGVYTKTKMLCEKHGEWNTTSIDTLLDGRGCARCSFDLKVIPDEVMIESFFASGAFHPDTKFWRSGRVTKAGVKAYWHIFCPACSEVSESWATNMQNGQRSCRCSKQSQTTAYINLVYDGFFIQAVKFGITNNTKRRVRDQDRNSFYRIVNHLNYIFKDTTSCKKAERECLQELECGVVLKRDLPDGYTETTWAYNLDKIIEIYERNGGIRVEHSANHVA